MKKLMLVVAALVLVGCSNTPMRDGSCATLSYGVCLAKWHNGVVVPSGEIDMRYSGLAGSDADGNFSGTVSVSGKEWF